MNGSFVPVVIDLRNQGDNVAHFQAQLSLVLRLKVIQDFTAWLHCRDTRQQKRERDIKKKTLLKYPSEFYWVPKFFQIKLVGVLFAEHDS